MALFGSAKVKITDSDLKKLQILIEQAQQAKDSLKAEQDILFEKSRKDITMGGRSGLSMDTVERFRSQQKLLYKNLILQLNKIIADIEKKV